MVILERCIWGRVDPPSPKALRRTGVTKMRIKVKKKRTPGADVMHKTARQAGSAGRMDALKWLPTKVGVPFPWRGGLCIAKLVEG